ncbi:MAG: DUF418 domain-containing protein [Chitinophagaceae bacterium]
MASSPIEASTPVDEHSLKAFSPHYLPENERTESLDVIKGMAVLFGMFISVYVWGGFSDGMQYQLLSKEKGSHHIIYVLMSFFLERKMQGLISLVFGAGMILFLVRSHAGSPVQNAELMVRRNMWLILFGLFNAFVFLWPRDILFHLGIMGLLLFPFCRMKPKGLIIAVMIVSLIGIGKNYWYFTDDQKAYSKYLVVQDLEKKFSKDSTARMKTNDSLLFKKPQAGKLSVADSTANKKIADSLAKKAGDTLTRKQNDEKQAWEGIAKKFTYDGKKDSANNKEIQAISYVKNWNHLLQQIKSRESGWFYRNGVWEFAAIILLGMYLFKLGFFHGRFSNGQYLMMAVTGILTGLLCGWYRLHFLNISIQDYTAFVKTKTIPHNLVLPFENAFMVFGIAAKIMWVIQKGMFRRITSVFADVGKLALTNYLMQSLILSVFFYGYGMGYYGRVGQFKLYFLVAEICLTQLVFSVFWCRYFYVGPAEWLLRSLMYKKKIPFSRKTKESSSNQDQTLNTVI